MQSRAISLANSLAQRKVKPACNAPINRCDKCTEICYLIRIDLQLVHIFHVISNKIHSCICKLTKLFCVHCLNKSFEYSMSEYRFSRLNVRKVWKSSKIFLWTMPLFIRCILIVLLLLQVLWLYRTCLQCIFRDEYWPHNTWLRYIIIKWCEVKADSAWQQDASIWFGFLKNRNFTIYIWPKLGECEIHLFWGCNFLWESLHFDRNMSVKWNIYYSSFYEIYFHTIQNILN